MRAIFAEKVKEELIFILADSGKEVAPCSNLFERTKDKGRRSMVSMQALTSPQLSVP